MSPLKNIVLYLRKNFMLTILLLIFIISLASAFLFYSVEFGANKGINSFAEAVWWVLVTITTVGYGDIVPVTETGRILGVFIIFTGVALVSVFTATVSSIFVTQRLREEKGLKQIKEKQHVILCGWHQTAEQILAVIFANSSSPVVMINQLSEDEVRRVIEKFKKKPLHYVRGDFAREEILNRADITNASTVVIIPDVSGTQTPAADEKTILTAFAVKAMQPKIKVYAHITDRSNIPYLKKAMVDDYLVSDYFSGVLMGEMVTEPGVSQSVNTLMGLNEKGALKRVPLPGELHGKKFKDVLEYFRTKGLLPIALVKENKPVSIADLLSEDASYLDAFIEKKFKEAGRTLRKSSQPEVQVNPPDDAVVEKGTYVVVIK